MRLSGIYHCWVILALLLCACGRGDSAAMNARVLIAELEKQGIKAERVADNVHAYEFIIPASLRSRFQRGENVSLGRILFTGQKSFDESGVKSITYNIYTRNGTELGYAMWWDDDYSTMRILVTSRP